VVVMGTSLHVTSSHNDTTVTRTPDKRTGYLTLFTANISN
jgi:hypothetical protein